MGVLGPLSPGTSFSFYHLTKVEMTQEDKDLESTDQPDEESTDDQPDDESDDENVYESDDDQPNEESDDDTVEIDGEFYSKQEAKELLSKGRDYTKKTQELAALRRQIEAQTDTSNQPSAEDKAAIERLKALGIPTAKEVEAMIARVAATQNVNSQRERIKKEFSYDDAMVNAAYSYSITAGISLEEAARKLAPQNRIVKKKSLGAKGSKSVTATTTSGEMTLESARAELRELAKAGLKTDKDKKRFELIRDKMEKRELK